MYYFGLTVFLTLVVFIWRLPAAFRRFRDQREALRPVRPVAGADHLPCVVNTIGAAITEFFMLGLLTVAVFLGSSAALGTLDQAPTLATGIRNISLGALGLMIALAVIIALLLIGGAFARQALMFLALFAIVTWMVMSSTGEQWPALLIFALLACGAPALIILLIRLLF